MVCCYNKGHENSGLNKIEFSLLGTNLSLSRPAVMQQCHGLYLTLGLCFRKAIPWLSLSHLHSIQWEGEAVTTSWKWQVCIFLSFRKRGSVKLDHVMHWRFPTVVLCSLQLLSISLAFWYCFVLFWSLFLVLLSFHLFWCTVRNYEGVLKAANQSHFWLGSPFSYT